MLASLGPICRNVRTENVSILVAVDITIFQRSVLYPFLDELKDKRSGELIAERSNGVAKDRECIG